MAETLCSCTNERFQDCKPIILCQTCYLILYLKSSEKCFWKGRALSNVFWIYKDKIVISCRIEFHPSETVKQFINWWEDSDKKHRLTGAEVTQAIHYHQCVCDVFPTEEANFNFPSSFVVVSLYTLHPVSPIVNTLHYYDTLPILIFQGFCCCF